MALVKSIVVLGTPTSIGDLTFNGNLGGVAPTGCMFYITRNTAFNVKQDENNGSWGFSDSSLNMWTSGWTDEDGQLTMDSGRLHNTTHCAIICAPGDQATLDVSCRVLSGAFGTADEVTVNFDNVDASNSYKIVCVMFAGETCQVGSFNAVGPINTEKTVTTTSITPRTLFVAGQSLPNPVGSNMKNSLGMGCLYNSSIEQGMHYQFADNNALTSNIKANTSNNRIARHMGSSGIESYGLELTDVSSGSFGITTRDAAGSTTENWGYLAIETAVDEAKIVEMSVAASATIQTFTTDTGFTSDFLMLIGGMVTNYNTQETGFDAEGFTIGVTNGTDESSCCYISEDGAGTSNTFSVIVNNQTLMNRDGANAVLLTAAFDSFNVGNFKLNFSVASQAAKYIALVFKEPVPLISGHPQFYNRRRAA